MPADTPDPDKAGQTLAHARLNHLIEFGEFRTAPRDFDQLGGSRGVKECSLRPARH